MAGPGRPGGASPSRTVRSRASAVCRTLRRRSVPTAAGALAAALVVSAAWSGGLLDRSAGHRANGTVSAADGLRHTRVDVSRGRCGRGWVRPHPGTQVFDMHNTSNRAAEVYLKDVRTGAAYGEVDGLGPGTTRTLRANIGPGSYAFACYPDDSSAVTGPTVHVPGGGAKGRDGPHARQYGEQHDRQSGGPAAVPVSQHDLIPPTIAYQKWVGSRTGDLVGATGGLRRAVDSGDLARARAAWLPAHLVYERMGAAYGAFGDADQAINGTTAGLPHGVRDEDFTGFHRIEYGLWHGESAKRLRPLAARLEKDARALRTHWRHSRMDPLDLGLRAHEILEDTVQSELTGRTDYGSGSNLATARANVDGTRAVLKRLRPLLRSRYPALHRLDRELDAFRRTLDRHHRGGHWTPLDRLARAPRQKIDADAGRLVEDLADIAALCDVRRTS